MKRKIHVIALIVLALAFVFEGYAQTLTQANFIAVKLPQYMSGGVVGGSARLHVVYQARIENLLPNTTYKFYNQAAAFTDIGGTNSGAGNPLFTNPDSANYYYTSSTSLTNITGYRTFTTNAQGQYTGWFAYVNTGNARFGTAKRYVTPTIVLANIDSTTAQYKLALNDSIQILAIGTAAADSAATAIWGESSASPRNIIALYDNILGTGKPLAITYVENEGVTVATVAQFYTDSVNARNKRWGTIIPNVNANGVRRVEQLSLTTGNVIAYSISNTGVWTSGANTVNPVSGSTPVVLTNLDAPVPVEFTSFTATVAKNSVVLSWTTATESNNAGFDIERKSDNGSFEKVGFVKGQGTSTSAVNYSFSDKNVKSGNYTYRLKQVDFDGTASYSKTTEVSVNTPSKFDLAQNHPNPFNPSTIISFSLPSNSFVTLKVYNVLGKEVSVLINKQMEAGNHSVAFNTTSLQLASGVYFYKLEANNSVITKKMILSK